MKPEDDIEICFRDLKWREARKLILTELALFPRSHWLTTRLSTTYYEERKYKKALVVSKRALKLDPQCPLILWDYACVLDMLGEEKSAIAVWKRLLRRGEKAVAFDKCGEGIRWARSLLNDCRYRIGVSFLDVGNKVLGKQYMVEHLRYRRPGIPSSYSMKDVREAMKRCE
jgi:hypothetical protein